MRQFKWFLLAQVINQKEHDLFLQHIHNAKLHSNVVVEAYLIIKKNTKVVHSYTITCSGVTANVTSFTNSKGLVSNIKHVVENTKDVDGILYYGHSSGSIIGNEEKYILMPFKEFVEVVVVPLQPRVVMFDSCLIGNLDSLYYLSRVKSIIWVMASPSYHPFLSVIQCPAFGLIGSDGKTKTKLRRHLRHITSFFQRHASWPSYVCYLLIDLKLVPMIMSKLKEYLPILDFTKENRLHSSDKETYDLISVIKDSKRLLNRNKASLIAACTKITESSCCINACQHSNGIAITHTPSHL